MRVKITAYFMQPIKGMQPLSRLPSSLLLVVLFTLGFLASNTSHAQYPYSNPYGAQAFSGPSFGAPSFGGPAPFIGENASNEAALINCRCAALVLAGKEDEDMTCANFKNFYQRQIMSAGSTGVINVPAQTPTH
jgi:hypothetical protein